MLNSQAKANLGRIEGSRRAEFLNQKDRSRKRREREREKHTQSGQGELRIEHSLVIAIVII